MIITRTPYRISFFGGGTDYLPWYKEHGGQVVSTTINHYCYLSFRYLAPFFKHKSRIVWSKDERVSDNANIEHNAVNAALKYLNIDKGIEIHHQGDLPARSGLGSSSAFSVGLLHGLYALKNIMSSKRQLACEAVHLEKNILQENVGVQDQISTAYGGLNKITIHQNGDFDVSPIILPSNRVYELEKNLVLVFTGISRTASDIAGSQIKEIKNKQSVLAEMHSLTKDAVNILSNGSNVNEFGKLLHHSWMLKKSISNNITTSLINNIYETAIKSGALGGKLLGAGGGGFMLFFVEPKNREKLLHSLKDLLCIPFSFENSGSQIIFYDNTPLQSQKSLERRDFMHLNNKDNSRISSNLELQQAQEERISVLST